MKDQEKLLITLLSSTTRPEMQALILQSYIQENGPLSNEAGDKVKAILKGDDPK